MAVLRSRGVEKISSPGDFRKWNFVSFKRCIYQEFSGKFHSDVAAAATTIWIQIWRLKSDFQLQFWSFCCDKLRTHLLEMWYCLFQNFHCEIFWILKGDPCKDDEFMYLFRCTISQDINALKTKRRLLYIKTQFVPHSKHFSSRL